MHSIPFTPSIIPARSWYVDGWMGGWMRQAEPVTPVAQSAANAAAKRTIRCTGREAERAMSDCLSSNLPMKHSGNLQRVPSPVLSVSSLLAPPYSSCEKKWKPEEGPLRDGNGSIFSPNAVWLSTLSFQARKPLTQLTLVQSCGWICRVPCSPPASFQLGIGGMPHQTDPALRGCLAWHGYS